MPNVPFVPGVPALTSYATGQLLSILVRDIALLVTGGFFQEWGIFLDGNSAVPADSVISFDFRREWTVSNYPLEKGTFESYDKVQLPFEAKMRFSVGGTVNDRQQFLDTIDSIAGGLNLYDVVTPEETYRSVSITHYDYRRTATDGVGLLLVDLWCSQVRVTATTKFSSTKTPSGADSSSGGAVTALPPGDDGFKSRFDAMGGAK